MEKALFLDASYAIALSVATDKHHIRSAALAGEIERERFRLVTTRAVALEIGNALAKEKYRQASAVLLETDRGDGSGRRC